MAERMAKTIPSAQVEEIAGAHHHVTLDAPEALAECVRAWLA
jgi:pimeloyl-ACP methyl ester carboxylesterase